MAVTKIGEMLCKLAAMDEDALDHVRELLEKIRDNKLKTKAEEEFQIGTLPESVANKIYEQLESDYRHSGNAAWRMTLRNLRHISKNHINPKNVDKKTQTTIDNFIRDLRYLGMAADSGNLDSAISYDKDYPLFVDKQKFYFKSPFVWSKDTNHIVNGNIPFAFLQTPTNGVFDVRTQYPVDFNYINKKSNSKPLDNTNYLPENEYHILQKSIKE